MRALRKGIATNTLGCVVACALAALCAMVERPEAAAQPTAASASAQPAAGSTADQAPRGDDPVVPQSWLPPGAAASPDPSEVVYPPQKLPVSFDHRQHITGQKLGCGTCHPRASTSDDAGDRLLPDPVVACDECHGVDHPNRRQRSGQFEADGRCATCHIVENRAGQQYVPPISAPPPNLRFPHRKHAQRNIGCGHCHGSVGKLGLATRHQLPRMAGCLVCHAKSGASAGDAKSTCVTCHPATSAGRLRTSFRTGSLQPPRWLQGADHATDWIERHKPVAATNSGLCANCHTNRHCIGCHEATRRPQTIHGGDWLSRHAQSARQDNPRCTGCHQLQSFCAPCHRRLGIARDVASAARPAGRRFHPAPSEWSRAPRGPRHHAWEAMRNLNACVGCHSERDCATCHATRGVRGGAGVNPHPPGFGAACGWAYARNPRPCLVCHMSGDPLLSPCQ